MPKSTRGYFFKKGRVHLRKGRPAPLIDSKPILVILFVSSVVITGIAALLS